MTVYMKVCTASVCVWVRECKDHSVVYVEVCVKEWRQGEKKEAHRYSKEVDNENNRITV